MKRFLPVFQTVIITSTVVLLTCCAHVPHAKKAERLTADNYLQLAQQSQGEKKQEYRLKAIDSYLATHQTVLASKLMDLTLPDQLTSNLADQLKLQKAQLTLLQHQPGLAINLLSNLRPDSLSTNNQIKYYKILAKAYRAQGDVIQSVNMQNNLSGLITTSDDKKQNLWSTWQSLQSLSINQLQTYIAQTTSKRLLGWLNLTLITKQYDNNPEKLLQKLSGWQSNYPDHPGNKLLPKQFSSQHGAIKPKQIAMLLPISGPYQTFGNAIKNGFFAAYYAEKNTNSKPINIRIYDTNNQNIKSLYQKAVSEGANFVVGPLKKDNLQQLVNSGVINTPTLSLNMLSPTKENNNKNLYEFGLSPTDEAIQAAQQADKMQNQKVIIISKSDAWSKAIVDAFKEQWQAFNNTVVETAWLSGHGPYSNEIRNLLGISFSYKNKHDLQNILHEKMRFIPRRRKDFDSIFLVANSKDAKQILPLLHFYFVNNTPVFSTSQIFNTIASINQNKDLEGVYFCDIPWLLEKPKDDTTTLAVIKNHISSIWATQYKNHPRFYALGVDAFDITQNLNKMKMLPNLSTSAATGALTILPNHQIYRQLPWAVFRDGMPKQLTSVDIAS